MIHRRLAILALLLIAATRASAHRLDEYLQATTFDLSKTKVAVEVRLTPGVDVLGSLLPKLDPNGDGVVSADERRAYAQRVVADLSLTINGRPAPLHLLAWTFPDLDQIREGLGEIVLTLDADVPPARSGEQTLAFENRHEPKVSVYLANCFTPADPQIRILDQARGVDQRTYRVTYSLPAAPSARAPHAGHLFTWWLAADAATVLATAVFLLRGRRHRHAN